MNHREKLRLARKMLTEEERIDHVSPFQGKAWLARALARQERIKKVLKEKKEK